MARITKQDGDMLREVRVERNYQDKFRRVKHIQELMTNLSNQDAVRLLGDLNTQLARSTGWFSRGYLRLAYTNDPNHGLEFKRKYWFQMLYHDDRNEETAVAVQALVDKVKRNDMPPGALAYFENNTNQAIKIAIIRSHVTSIHSALSSNSDKDIENEIDDHEIFKYDLERLNLLKVTSSHGITSERGRIYQAKVLDEEVEEVEEENLEVALLEIAPPINIHYKDGKLQYKNGEPFQARFWDNAKAQPFLLPRAYIVKEISCPENASIITNVGSILSPGLELEPANYLLVPASNNTTPQVIADLHKNKNSMEGLTIEAILMHNTSKPQLLTLLRQKGCQVSGEDVLLVKEFIIHQFAPQLLKALKTLSEEKEPFLHGRISLGNIFADPQTGEIQITAPWEPCKVSPETLYKKINEPLNCYDHPALAIAGEGVGFEQDLYSAGITLMMAYLEYGQGKEVGESFKNRILYKLQALRNRTITYSQATADIQNIIDLYSKLLNSNKEFTKIKKIASALIMQSLVLNSAGNHQAISTQSEYQIILSAISKE